MKLILDIGLSKIHLAVLDKNLSEAKKEARNFQKTPSDWVVDTIKKSLLQYPKVESLSIASSGLMSESGSDYFLEENIDLKDKLKDQFNLPVSLINDGNAAALSAMLFVDKDSFLSFHLGTGVGVGIVINKGIYTGSHGYAGEIGADLGGKRIEDIYFAQSGNKKQAYDIKTLADEKDQDATSSIKQARDEFIQTVIRKWRFIDPEAIVFSGGGILDIYRPGLIEEIEHKIGMHKYSQPFLLRTEIRENPFKTFAPLIGAAYLSDDSLSLEDFSNYLEK